MSPPTNVNVMIANSQNETLSENPTPHTIDIDMHIQLQTNPLTNVPVMIPDPRSMTQSEDALREDEERATNTTARAKQVAGFVPVPILTPSHVTAPPHFPNTTAAKAVDEIGNNDKSTKQNKIADTISNKIGSTAQIPPKASKYLSKSQRKKASAKAAAARKSKRKAKRTGGTNTRCKRIAIAKDQQAQEKLRKRGRGPRRF